MSEKINVKFILMDSGSSKLMLVKAIKSVTGWGLKEAKDFVDSVDTRYQPPSSNRGLRPAILELQLSKSDLDEFEKVLKNCIGVAFELDGTSNLRNRKLIELGLYDKDEIVGELVEDDLYRVLRGDVSIIRDLLKERYSQLSEEYIIKTIQTKK